MTIQLPDFVVERINLISQKTGIDIETLNKAYLEIFSDPFVQTDPQFQTDLDRHRYSVAILWARYIARPPAKEWQVIPIGIGPVRQSRLGPVCCVMALTKSVGKLEMRRVIVPADSVEQIQLFAGYKVLLGQFKTGDLIADSRTRWENPTNTGVDANKIIEMLKIKRITIAEAKKNLSRIGPDGYVDETDWRVIRGIIVSSSRGEKEGREWANYVIVDETVEGEPRVTSDGRVLRPGFTVWANPILMVYDSESEVDCVGTVQLGSQTQEPFMNAYLIIPVVVRR
jgi:hypothetical protein